MVEINSKDSGEILSKIEEVIHTLKDDSNWNLLSDSDKDKIDLIYDEIKKMSSKEKKEFEYDFIKAYTTQIIEIINQVFLSAIKSIIK